MLAGQLKMQSRYLPLDRRDLRQGMVEGAVTNFFDIGIKLKLFSNWCLYSKGPLYSYALEDFSRWLFKRVQRRHTHLWNKTEEKSNV